MSLLSLEIKKETAVRGQPVEHVLLLCLNRIILASRAVTRLC